MVIPVIMYEFEYFSFLFILKLFSAGNVKKIENHVFIVPIATIGGFFKEFDMLHDRKVID